MAALDAKQFREMIREVVRKEIRELVPSVIAEVLSERYLRKLAEGATNLSARPRGVSDLDIMGDEEEPDEEVPHALANNIRGVGQEHPRFQKMPKQDHVRQHNEGLDGRDRNEMLSLFFEGTKPLDRAPAGEGEGVDLNDLIEDHGEVYRPSVGHPTPIYEELAEPASPEETDPKDMVQRWRNLNEAMMQKRNGSAPIDPQVKLAAEEARLKRIRESLDRPA